MVTASAQQNSLADCASVTETAYESCLLERYLPLVRSRANTFRQKGVEADDLIQEGLIGLLYAIRAYNHEAGASFETFAYVCITNRLRTAITRADKKQIISLDSEETASDYIWNRKTQQDPEEIVISYEQIGQWLKKVDNCLSGYEHQTIRFYLGGYSYQEIAKMLNTTPKAVDNALQRARRKLRKF